MYSLYFSENVTIYTIGLWLCGSYTHCTALSPIIDIVMNLIFQEQMQKVIVLFSPLSEFKNIEFEAKITVEI